MSPMFSLKCPLGSATRSGPSLKAGPKTENASGLDVALEALTDAWRSKRLRLNELNLIAKKLRVQRVMQPYLETVVL